MSSRPAINRDADAATRATQHHSTAWPRIAPFGAYIVLMALGQSPLPFIDPVILYGVQLAITALLLVCLWPAYAELHAGARIPATDWLLSVAIGVLVYISWLLLDAPWMQLGDGQGVAATLSGPNAQWPALALRAVGVVFIVLLILEVTGIIDIFKRAPR